MGQAFLRRTDYGSFSGPRRAVFGPFPSSVPSGPVSYSPTPVHGPLIKPKIALRGRTRAHPYPTRTTRLDVVHTSLSSTAEPMDELRLVHSSAESTMDERPPYDPPSSVNPPTTVSSDGCGCGGGGGSGGEHSGHARRPSPPPSAESAGAMYTLPHLLHSSWVSPGKKNENQPHRSFTYHFFFFLRS